MPKLIKVTDYGSGQEMFVNANVIFCVWRPHPIERTTLESVSGHEHIREAPETVVSRIGDSVPMIELHSAEGFPIWVNPVAIFSVFQRPGETVTIVKSISTLEPVIETPEQIIKMMGAGQ